jgi:hypothetical protein
MHAAAALIVCGAAGAQGLPAFPAGGTAPAAQDIKAFVSDKTFVAARSDGSSGKFNYRGDGKFDVIYPRAKEYGTWRAEEGKLCVEDPVNGPACNEVRIVEGTFYYRRNRNGEVITFQPQ